MGNTAMERIVGPRLPNSRARQPPTFAANKTTIRRHAASRIAKPYTSVLWQDLGRRSGYFSCFEVPLESSQVSSDIRGMLVPQAEVFFQRLVDRDSTSAEMCGLSCDAGIGVECRIAPQISPELEPSKGIFPVAIS